MYSRTPRSWTLMTLLALSAASCAKPPESKVNNVAPSDNKTGATAQSTDKNPPDKATPPAVATDPHALKPPAFSGNKVVKKLPGMVADVAVGGGGRFLVLHLPKLKKLALFDVNELTVTQYINLDEENVRYTAGLDKVVVLMPEKSLIQRWDLWTCAKELTVPLGVKDAKGVLMGSASQGPIWVGSEFLDLKSLRPLDVKRNGRGGFGGNDLGNGAFARAAADGKVFGSWNPNVSPQGIRSLVLEGSEARLYYEHNSAGHIIPGPDGKFLYTGRGVYTNQAKAIGDPRTSRDLYVLPAVMGDFYLGFNPGEHADSKGKGARLTIYLAGENRPVVTLPRFELSDGINSWDRDPFGFDKRIHFLPDANVILTIPSTNDSIVAHRVDIVSELDKSGIDYLVVTSRPPAAVKKGETFTYPVVVKSKKGGVKYKIDSGPMGMTISAAGLIQWKAPADGAGANDVIVNIRDASGQECFHTFSLTVKE